MVRGALIGWGLLKILDSYEFEVLNEDILFWIVIYRAEVHNDIDREEQFYDHFYSLIVCVAAFIEGDSSQVKRIDEEDVEINEWYLKAFCKQE